MLSQPETELLPEDSL